jgi:hypothetical protein
MRLRQRERELQRDKLLDIVILKRAAMSRSFLYLVSNPKLEIRRKFEMWKNFYFNHFKFESGCPTRGAVQIVEVIPQKRPHLLTPSPCEERGMYVFCFFPPLFSSQGERGWGIGGTLRGYYL